MFRSSNYAEQTRSTEQPSNPLRRPLFRLRHPPRRFPAHNDFWLVTLTYARYFEQTWPFYFDSNATEVSRTRVQLILVQLYKLKLLQERKKCHVRAVKCIVEYIYATKVINSRQNREN